mgnify:CR=1 FL=1
MQCLRCYRAEREANKRPIPPASTPGGTVHIETGRLLRGIGDYSPRLYANIARYRPRVAGFWERIEREVSDV